MCEPRRFAVVDRIVEGRAVLILEPDETEHAVPAGALPEGAGEGAVVLVEQAGEQLRVLAVDADETARRHADARGRLDNLRARRGGGRFRRPD